MKIFLLVFAFLLSACSSPLTNKKLPQKESGYAPVNGISMYYETFGPSEGIPLVLIHGGGSTIESNWGRFIPLLEKNMRIIAIEEQAHGRSSDRTQGVSFEQTAEDIAALLDHLKVQKANIMGFSNGGTTAMVLAFRHPQKVNKLIAASALTKHSGVPVSFWEFMKTAQLSNMPKPLADAFLKVNPDKKKLQTMHDKDARRMQVFKDIADSELAKITAPTLIILGDQDLIKVSHALEHVKSVKGARLVVLPSNHGEYVGEVFATRKESSTHVVTAKIIENFLAE